MLACLEVLMTHLITSMRILLMHLMTRLRTLLMNPMTLLRMLASHCKRLLLPKHSATLPEHLMNVPQHLAMCQRLTPTAAKKHRKWTQTSHWLCPQLAKTQYHKTSSALQAQLQAAGRCKKLTHAPRQVACNISPVLWLASLVCSVVTFCSHLTTISPHACGNDLHVCQGRKCCLSSFSKLHMSMIASEKQEAGVMSGASCLHYSAMHVHN